MRVIGTAGHVDHGKSTLVEALTGIHPDRLKEEREREMTIDLGFAWMELPSGEEVGIVDVPGHRDFIENMLAGIGGIDAALFVVAADEGVMPQTREHLAILDILQISGGVVALTKIDLVQSEDLDETGWLELVEEEISQLLEGTTLENAPVIRVSARKRVGLEDLRGAIDTCLSAKPSRPDYQKPRLPVDRIFTIPGFGTVVTGTLSDGILNVGDELEILPAGLRGRVRGLQTHRRKHVSAIPGSRTAVNISGVNIDQIHRGDVISKPGIYQTTRRVDVHFRLLPDVKKPLRHNSEVKFFIGSAEVVARVRLLGTDGIEPGEEGWLQLELREPVVAVRGDRFILRRPSPGETLGGGRVVDPHPKGRHKRFRSGLLERLESLSKGSPADILYQAASSLGIAAVNEIVARSNLELNQANQALQELVENGRLFVLEESLKKVTAINSALVVTSSTWESIVRQAVNEVDRFHHENPLRRGMPREELKSRMRLSPRLFNAIVERIVFNGDLDEAGPLVFRPGHQVKFSQNQENDINKLMSIFESSPFSPPSIKETKGVLGDDVFNALVDIGLLIPVSDEVVFRKADYDRMIIEIRGLLQKHGEITAAQVRDHFNTSRKYVLALLEHMDNKGITVREGDVRKLKL
jgi:selenocysteine-specific elongation factor